jgi:Tfp pilus assembly protein PilN
MATDYRKWLAIGTGVGIEILAQELHVTITRVRPNGIAVLGSATVTDYRNRPAAEWGAELLAFLKQIGAAHIAANVLLPRRDVVVRPVAMPGVKDEDLQSAIALQIDSLHPYGEDEAVYAYARIGKTPSVLVGITQRDVLDRYTALFAEAGLKVASFTFSAASLHSALRVHAKPPVEFVAVHQGQDEFEIYGESESKPVFSAGFAALSDKAISFAASELRLTPGTAPVPLHTLLPKPVVFPPNHDPQSGGFEQRALPYATAVAGACPWLAMQANLLPPELRKGSSRIRLIPTFVLGSLLLLLMGAIGAYSSYENNRYLKVLQGEIKKLEPAARKLDSLDKKITESQARAQFLQEYKKHSREDLDALNELTKLVAPPGYLQSVEVRRNQIIISGEVDAAANLVKVIDSSPLFEGSEFTMAPTRVQGGEVFSIRANREAPKK